MKILTFPNPGLLQVAEPCTAQEIVSEEFKKACVEMCAIVNEHEAIGLAATQVGWGKRVFVMHTQDGVHEFVNPEIQYIDDDQRSSDEGCLSFPGVTEMIKAPVRVGLRYTTIADVRDSRFGNHDPYKEQVFYGLHARCVFHEVDHLNGKTMLDRMGKLQRKMFLKRYNKANLGWGP